jgi:thiosulfate/3-mercaptopyruvate sulfurtransferase
MAQSQSSEFSKSEYSVADALVDTNWVEQHLKDPNVRVAEVDYDPAANYATGHVPGAVLLDWRKDMNDVIQRDIVRKDKL